MNRFSQKVMKNAHWLVWSLIVMALATSAQGQSAVTSVPAGRSLETPANDILVLSNVTGKVRVLDSKGLLLETNLVYLPRIKLSDLSQAELQALLETKTAYAALTAYGSLNGRMRKARSLKISFNKSGCKGSPWRKKCKHVWKFWRTCANIITTLPSCRGAWPLPASMMLKPPQSTTG